MAPQIVIAICSCCSYHYRRVAIQNTWLKSLPKHINAQFFVGEGDGISRYDAIQLPVADDYAGQCKKVQMSFKYALDHYEFDYILKCDDDTYVESSRIAELVESGSEFVGSWDLSHLGYAHGGAGYILSRRACQIVADAGAPYRIHEDIWVSLVVQSVGIRFKPSTRLLMGHLDFPSPNNDIISAHWCTPEMLQLIYEGFIDRGSTDVQMFYLANHSDWWGPLKLLRNGVFLGNKGDPAGTWELVDNSDLMILSWYRWPTDVLHKSTHGYQNSTLRLDLVWSASA